MGAGRAEGLDLVRPVRRLGGLPGPHRPDGRRSTRGSPTWWSTCTHPGVEVRPLVQLTGEAEFNEVFLSDVFVPDDQLIGPEHEGWRVANSTLSHERGTNPRQLVIHMQLLEELLRLAEQNGSFDDRRLRRRLAQAYVEVRLFQLHNLRSVSRLSQGLDPGPEGSALKLYWSEMSKRFHDTAMAVLGDAAPLWKGADDNPGDGGVAALVALLPGLVDLGRHQRDPAQRHRRAGPRAPRPARRQRGRPGAGRSSTTREQTTVTTTWCSTQVAGHVATITMNRPDVANAQDTALIDGIDHALDLADADDEVRVVILAGTGRHFSSGHDLKELVGGRAGSVARRSARRPRASSATSRSCTSTAASASTRSASRPSPRSRARASPPASCWPACATSSWPPTMPSSPNPVLRMTGAGVELLVEPWELGIRKAKEFLWTGEKIDAQEAWRLGLVNRVVPTAELAERIRGAGRTGGPGPADHGPGGEGHHQQQTATLMGKEASWKYHFMAHHWMHNTETAARRPRGPQGEDVDEGGLRRAPD